MMVRTLVLGLLAGLALGCGTPPPADRAIITGVVKYKGQIMPYGRVTFVSVDDPNLRDPCTINSEGTFVLTNAPVGRCKVVIQINDAYDHQTYMVTGKAKPADLVPRDIADKYKNETTTPLEVTIDPKQKTIELEIK